VEKLSTASEGSAAEKVQAVLEVGAKEAVEKLSTASEGSAAEKVQAVLEVGAKEAVEKLSTASEGSSPSEQRNVASERKPAVVSLSPHAAAFVTVKVVPPLPPGPPPALSAEEAAKQRFGWSDGSKDGGGKKGQKPGDVRQREKKREKKREEQSAADKAQREQRWKEMLRVDGSWAEWQEKEELELLSPVSSRPSGVCSLTRSARLSPITIHPHTHTPPTDSID
jgi:hypothetical protein